MLRSNILLLLFVTATFSACGTKSRTQETKEIITNAADTSGMKKAVFASGCFWCVEAIFESVEGVGEVISGYSGGTPESANYSAVSSGMSKHAEAVEIYYDPAKISYNTLLSVFFDSHDPTTLNRQGPDYGFQYRSAIFYANEDEQLMARSFIDSLATARKFSAPITTLVDPLVKFYPAEGYHQDYERKNPDNGYVQGVSVPRLKKFQQRRPELLKKSVSH